MGRGDDRAADDLPMFWKWCPGCRTRKPSAEFSRKGRGLQTQCMDCKAAQAARMREEDPEAERARHRRHYLRHREAVIARVKERQRR